MILFLMNLQMSWPTTPQIEFSSAVGICGDELPYVISTEDGVFGCTTSKLFDVVTS